VRGRDFLSIHDLTTTELVGLLDHAAKLKAGSALGGRHEPLAGKVLALVFEKPSLRTRTTFDVGMFKLGGRAVYLGPDDVRMGARETPADVAKNLERWVDGIAARVFAHSTVEVLAQHAGIPVINALSDWEHPCQALAAMLTIRERCGRIDGIRLAWIGDGNNTARSVVCAGAKLGMNIVVATPEEYRLDANTVERARAEAWAAHGRVETTVDPVAAVRGADVIYTDVWTSMGQEASAAARLRVFQPYQVNAALLARAPAHAIVMHCLPAHRGEEVAAEVLDSPRSAAFDEAENRLHTQNALLVEVLS